MCVKSLVEVASFSVVVEFEFFWRDVVQSGVPVIGVDLLLSVCDDRACFVNVVKGVHVQTLVPDAIVEGFNESITPGSTGWNVVNSIVFLCKLLQCF